MDCLKSQLRTQFSCDLKVSPSRIWVASFFPNDVAETRSGTGTATCD